jgi:hypothetical protein
MAVEISKELTDSSFIMGNNHDAITIAAKHDIGAIEEALIILALSKTEANQVVSEMFEPQPRRHREPVQTLDKPETRFLASS